MEQPINEDNDFIEDKYNTLKPQEQINEMEVYIWPNFNIACAKCSKRAESNPTKLPICKTC
jgi:hypothetical protein